MINKRLAIFFAVSGAVGQAFAQNAIIRPAYEFPGVPSGPGPASVRVAESPVFFTPYVGVALSHDDNIFISDTNRKASNLYIVSPGFKLDARDPNKVLQAAYQAQVGRYTSSSDDNYVDQTAKAQLDMAMDPRNFFRLGMDYIRSHDPRGSTDRPTSTRPDRYRLSMPYATYAFGAPGAQGRMELYYSDATKRYLNNRDTTEASDRDRQEFGGVLYLRVAPRTYALAEARRTDYRYRLPNSPFNSREDRYFGGVSWEATAQTTGTIKVGRLTKRFDSDTPESKNTSWEAIIAWAPRTYSKFDFYATRTTTESTGLGDFLLSDIAGVAWNHSWTTYLYTTVDARYQKDRYRGADRTDETYALGLRAGYRFRRWLTLGAEYTYTQRDSNTNFFDYDRNIILLTATASM